MWFLLACTGGGGGESVVDVVDSDTSPTIDVAIRPWTNLAGDDAVRVRFETLDDVPVTVTLGETAIEATRAVRTVSYAWPDEENVLELEHWDRSGQHVVHEALFTGLSAGEHAWSVQLDELYEGTVRLAEVGDTVRFAFVGDTMMPAQDDVFAQAAAGEPDLFLHGGDFQYQTLPGDTWAGTFHALGPVAELAPIHVAIGNHEEEDHDELEQRTLPILGEQGEGGDRWHAFSYGGVRFVSIDTESDLGADSEQVAWLTGELEAAGDDIVVFFHRPIYTLGNHAPDTAKRDVLHPLFVEHGVDLVLQAHNHGYERFLVDDIPYVLDGGGGAATYDMSAQVEARPDEVELRQAVATNYGVTRVEVTAGGGMSMVRVDRDGETVDSATLR